VYSVIEVQRIQSFFAGSIGIGLLCSSSLQVLKRLGYTQKNRAIFRGRYRCCSRKSRLLFQNEVGGYIKEHKNYG